MIKIITYLTLIFVFGCKGKIQHEQIEINSSILEQYTNSEDLIIVTCTGCRCFIENLNALSKSDISYLSKYTVLADTTCNKFPFNTVPLNTRTLDSISTDIYNITLLTKVDDGFKSKVLQLSESKKIVDAVKNFFSSNR